MNKEPMNSCLGIDPGGKRMGWAVVANPHDRFDPKYVASGVYGLARKDSEQYQVYKLRLVEHFSLKAHAAMRDYLPVVVANEIQPAVGGGNYTVATQSELAKVSMVIYQTAGFSAGLKVVQFGANTIKKVLTNNKKASKVKVRDAVIEYFPELADRRSAWQVGKEGLDESDAIGICLTYFLTKEYPSC